MNSFNENHSNLAIDTIVQLIWKLGAQTRAELSRISGFSRSTITLNADRLLSLGILIEEKPKGSEGKQNKRKCLMIRKDRGVFVGVELDAYRCEVGLCNIMGKLLCSTSFAVDFLLGPDEIYRVITAKIDELQSELTQGENTILGIGVGLPSPVDFAAGYAVHPAFMPGWHQWPIKDMLAKKYCCPVFVDNEVNTMGLGEAHLSKRYREKNLLFIKIGTGIGAGLIINGEIYRGNSGLSGNIGHIQVDCRSEQCQCGKVGCLEAIAGECALREKAERLAKEGKSPILAKLYANKGHLTLHDIKDAVGSGDRETLYLLQETADVVGTMIGRLVQFFDPKAVVLGGKQVSFGPQYIDYIRSGILKQATPWVKSDFEVNISKFGDKIGVIGSAMLCISSLISSGLTLEEQL
ncbi:MAG: ROK family protein [Sphaerochaeta sp.]|nr:ROK family protein [Sphaerochaeta sp.]